MGRRHKKGKKTCGSLLWHFCRKSKSTHKPGKIRNSFITTPWQRDVQPLLGQQTLSINNACTDKHYHSKHPPFLLFDWSCSSCSTPLWISLLTAWVHWTGSVPCQPLATSSLRLSGWAWVAARKENPVGFISHPGNQSFVSFLYPKSGSGKTMTEGTARMADPNWPYSIPSDIVLIKKSSGQRRKQEDLAMEWKNITGVKKTNHTVAH